MPDHIREDIERYLTLGVKWPLIISMINRRHGTAYRTAELRAQYEAEERQKTGE